MASAFPNGEKGDGFKRNTNAKPVLKRGDIEHWQKSIINGFIIDGRIPTEKEFDSMIILTGLTIDQIKKYISIKRCSSRKGRNKRKPGQFDRNTGRRLSETNPPPPPPRPQVPQTSNVSQAAKKMIDKYPLLSNLMAKEKMKLSYPGVSELANAPPNETLSLYDSPVQDNLPAELSSAVKDLLLREGSNWPSTHPVPIPTLGSLPSKEVRALTISNRDSSHYNFASTSRESSLAMDEYSRYLSSTCHSQSSLPSKEVRARTISNRDSYHYNFASTSRESSPAMDEYSRYLSSTCHSQSSSPSKKARFKKPTGNTQTEPLDLSPDKKVSPRADSRDSLPGYTCPFASTEDNIQSGEQNLSRRNYSEASAGNPAQTEPLDYSKMKKDCDYSDEGGFQRH